MDEFHFYGIGVSPIGRVVRFVATLFLLSRKNFQSHQLAFFFKDVVLNYIESQIYPIWVKHVSGNFQLYQVSRLSY